MEKDNNMETNTTDPQGRTADSACFVDKAGNFSNGELHEQIQAGVSHDKITAYWKAQLIADGLLTADEIKTLFGGV